MGDRTNPIKFGPEWLRNLAKEPSSPGTSSTTSREGIVISKNPLSPGGGGGASGSSVSGAGASASGDYGSPPGITSKILLAKLRYGREELLALYDRDTAEPPEQLKVIDLLYQPRGKPPYALNNTFEDEPNETPRSAVGNMASGDRYSSARGRGLSVDSRGRALSAGDNRLNRGRGFPRTTSLGRGGWHPSNQRNSYSGMPDDDPNQPSRSWNNNSGNNSGTRTGNEQSEWNRNKRQSTNWRQQHNNREGWEEWRSSNSSWGQDKQRGQEKWEWDPYSKDKSWNNNRRTWVGGDNNEDALPEWAVENAEACGGTFDSSGAFHGYSNDDSNLPKNQESPYPLTRSHTHGAFARSKTADEESDEWGASDKAKKVVAKRTPRVALDFNESQYRRRFPKDSSNTKPTLNLGSSQNSAGVHKEDSDNASPSADPKVGSNIPEQDKDGRDKQDHAQSPETDQNKDKQDKKPFPSKYPEKSFENKRSDSHNDESQDEKGNFKSVMIPSNNILRQKHQNIGTPTNETPTRQPHTPNFFEMLDSEEDNEKDSETNKLVEDILEMHLEDELPASMTNASGLPMRMNNSHMMKAMGSQKGGQNPNVPSTIQSGMPSSMMQPIGITNNMLNATLGLPLGPGPSLGHPMQGMPQPMPNTGLPNPGMMPGSLQGLGGGNMQPITRHPGGLPSSGSGIQGNIQNSMQGMPGSLQSGMQGALQAGMPGGPLQSGMPGPLQGGMPGSLQGGMPGQMQSGMPGPMQSGMPGQLQGGMPGQLQSGMPGQLQSGMPGPLQNGMPGQLQSGMQGGIQVPGLQSGIQNNGMPQQHNHNLQSGGGPSFQSNGANLPGISTSNVGNNSLFLNQGPGTPGMPNSNEINQPTMFAMHGLQQSPSQNAFNSSIYNNMMSNQSSNPMPQIPNMGSFLSLSDQWYYEDPENIIQGPFSSKEMYNWSQAGFFMATLMVRRACDNGMRPLGAYGMTPFSLIDRLPPLGFERRPQENINPQPGLGLDVMNHMVHNNMSNNLLIVPNIHTVHHNNGGMPNPLQFMPPGPRSPMFGQPPQQMVESLWGQPSQDVMWMQQGINSSRADNMMNNMPLFYWNRPSSAISSNALLPEEIAKEMKTEDQILAQLRAHNPAVPQNLPFIGDESPKKPEDAYDAQLNIGPNLEELQKLISKDNVTTPAGMIEVTDIEQVMKQEKLAKLEQNAEKQLPKADSKAAKPANKAEAEKAKTKENGSAKAKNKKNKDEKKEDGEVKVKEEETKNEKRSQEPSPTKSKKDEKVNKKDMEKEKKEWIKEGFTIVKGADKNKENKKKTDEIKAAEELERKRKEEEKLAAEEDKKRRQQQMETLKRQQEVQHQQQARQAAELNIKKAAWSVVPNQVINPTGREGLNLAEIQRLEREKKLEQMKEQQQMMTLMAQQQAATMAREQEIQANLGWAKKKTTSNLPGQSLAEIQAETRKQSAPAVAVREEAQATPPPVCQTPWSSAPLNGGFWDTPPNQAAAVAKPEKAPEPPKPVVEPVKLKKKVTVVPPKKESSPSAEFEAWCTGMLSAWQEANIDVPTFVAFLKDIESPYEVKDYVKCYLGDTKEASEFARQFLERRSRLLRVGMVTPSDDLCSPAIAINPRNNSNSDYQEVKGKGKKAKKNKMLKVDARILGFSVTASEDRINVGDIDTV